MNSTINIHSVINEKYGTEAVKRLRICENNYKKLAIYRNHLTFTTKCYHEQVIPKSMKISNVTSDPEIRQLHQELERKCVKVLMRQNRFQIRVHEQRHKKYIEELSCKMGSDEMSWEKWTLFFKDNTNIRLRLSAKYRRRSLRRFPGGL